MATNKWLLKYPSNLNMTGEMLQCVILEEYGVNQLSKALSMPNSSQIFFGDYKNWL